MEVPMRRYKMIFFTLALVVIFLVVEIIIVKNISDYEPETVVVFAKVRIPENTVIQPEMLVEKKVGISMAHKQSVRSISAIAGRKARMDIEEGEMVLSSKLAADNGMEEIKVRDSNNRLITVEFKADQANGWWIMPDQYVDIIFVPNGSAREKLEQGGRPGGGPGDTDGEEYGDTDRKGDELKPPIEVMRLRNIRVAAIIDEKGKILKKKDGSSLPKYISFEVTDRQDEFLASAKSSGRLEISVIPIGDETTGEP